MYDQRSALRADRFYCCGGSVLAEALLVLDEMIPIDSIRLGIPDGSSFWQAFRPTCSIMAEYDLPVFVISGFSQTQSEPDGGILCGQAAGELVHVVFHGPEQRLSSGTTYRY